MSEAVRLPESKRILFEKYLAQKTRKVSSEPDPIPRRPPNVPIPLSFWQQLLWLHSQMVSDLPVYNEPITVHRSGPLDVGILEKSLAEIFRRHEAWRTTFVVVDGQPVQVIQPPPRDNASGDGPEKRTGVRARSGGTTFGGAGRSNSDRSGKRASSSLQISQALGSWNTGCSSFCIISSSTGGPFIRCSSPN